MQCNWLALTALVSVQGYPINDERNESSNHRASAARELVQPLSGRRPRRADGDRHHWQVLFTSPHSQYTYFSESLPKSPTYPGWQADSSYDAPKAPVLDLDSSFSPLPDYSKGPDDPGCIDPLFTQSANHAEDLFELGYNLPIFSSQDLSPDSAYAPDLEYASLHRSLPPSPVDAYNGLFTPTRSGDHPESDRISYDRRVSGATESHPRSDTLYSSE